MNFNEPFRHPSNLVPGNDNEVQSTHVDDGHAGSQYSDPSLPSGSNGACQYSIRTNDAGGYRNYQNTGSPIFPQPDPVDNQYPQQIDPGDFLSEPIQQHAPQSEGSTFSPSLLEGDMKQDKAEHNLMLTHWGQPQPQPYNRNTFTLPTGYPGSQSNDFNDHRIRNIQHQAIAPYVLPGIGAYEPTLRQQGKLYNTQPCHGYQYFKEGPWNNHRIDPGHQQPNNAVFLSKDQRFEPEAPLSSVNTHQDHGQMLAWTVSNLVRRIDSNEAGCANNDGGGLSGLSDSIPNRQGMQPGIDTFRGDNDQTNNQMSRHGFLSAQLSRNEQSFGQPIGNPSQYLHVQTRLTDTTDATSTSKNACLPAPTRRPSRSSIASGASSDSFQCPSCSSMFSGVHGKGNWGRHNRQKHNGENKIFFCEKGCNTTFQRKDALLKHYRGRCHRL